jgi:hypothetical protein
MAHTLCEPEFIDASGRAMSAGSRMCTWGGLMKVMKKTLFAAVGVALGLPLAAAFAQSDDVSYCKQLSASVRTVTRGNSPTGSTADAMAQCDFNPRSGIPVLEKVLTDNKVSLPPRGGMAPPPSNFNAQAYRNTADCLTAAYAAKAPLSLCGAKQGM